MIILNHITVVSHALDQVWKLPIAQPMVSGQSGGSGQAAPRVVAPWQYVVATDTVAIHPLGLVGGSVWELIKKKNTVEDTHHVLYLLYKATGQSGQNGVNVLPNVMVGFKPGDGAAKSLQL